MSASWREGWEVGHALQERSQPLKLGHAASLGTRHRRPRLRHGSLDPGVVRAWSCRSERCRECCQPPPSSNLLPDYVTPDKRELFRPWFQLKQYSELTRTRVCVCAPSPPPARLPATGQQPELLPGSGG